MRIQTIFSRVEKKYLLTQEKYNELMSYIETYIEKDYYHYNTICNLYFDTIHYDIARNSIDKPIYKEKFRLRSYGVPKLEDDVFLEIKTKYHGVVNKRRAVITLKDAYDYIDDKMSMKKKDQIMRELDFSFDRYILAPSMYIAYERYSYFLKEDKNLRITFDANLRSRKNNLKLELGSFGTPIFNTPMYMMEIKTLGSMPIWLSKVLSYLKVYPCSFSKYGEIYKSMMVKEKIHV